MQTHPLDELEGALDRVARRISESSTPVSDAAQRVRKLEREPWYGLAWTAGLVGLALYSGRLLAAGGLLLAALPYKVARVHRRRDQIDGLNTEGDLLALEAKSLNEQHRRSGRTAALALWMGALFAGVGAFSPRPLVGLGAGALALLAALFLLLRVRPRLRRALADLGAEAEDHWVTNHLMVVFVLFFPVFMAVAFVRSLLGWEAQDEDDDDEDDEDDDDDDDGAEAAGDGSPQVEKRSEQRSDGEDSQ